MHPTIELGYLGVTVTDRAAFGAFLGDVVGLVPGAPADDGADTWRNDGKAQRLLVHEGATADATHLGVGRPTSTPSPRSPPAWRPPGTR